jgi:transcriptional regulator with XRE-family HTH domain
MPSKIEAATDATVQKLVAIGQQICAQRKALKISATVAAEACGISRVTLYRIEHGEPSVTIGAYMNALAALGLDLRVVSSTDVAAKSVEHPPLWIPARVRLADYPQLKQLAWQVHGTDELTPAEALSIYERNARHLDMQTLEPAERMLIDALRVALGDGSLGHPHNA